MLGWTIEDHRSAGGDSYIRHFLEDLTNPQDRKEAAALIKVLAMRGNLLREPISQALGDRLFELRGDQVRIFYTFRPGKRIVLLDGLVKKRGKIPTALVRRIRAMQREVG